MLIRLICAAALTSAISTQAMGAEDINSLPSSSDWVMDYSENACVLRRSFGAEDSLVYLEISQFKTGSEMQVAVAGEGLATTREDAEYRFAPGMEWKAEPLATRLRLANGGAGVRFDANLSGAEQGEVSNAAYLGEDQYREREAEIATLAIRGVFEDEIALAIGPLDEAMQAMRTCTDDLMGQWDIDPVVHGAAIRNVAAERQDRWSRRIFQGYPPLMLRQNEDGNVSVLLVVGANGRAERCVVTRSDAHPVLQEYTCEAMMKHSRFDPALDREGQPTRDVWTTTVTYAIN